MDNTELNRNQSDRFFYNNLALNEPDSGFKVQQAVIFDKANPSLLKKILGFPFKEQINESILTSKSLNDIKENDSFREIININSDDKILSNLSSPSEEAVLLFENKLVENGSHNNNIDLCPEHEVLTQSISEIPNINSPLNPNVEIDEAIVNTDNPSNNELEFDSKISNILNEKQDAIENEMIVNDSENLSIESKGSFDEVLITNTQSTDLLESNNSVSLIEIVENQTESELESTQQSSGINLADTYLSFDQWLSLKRFDYTPETVKNDPAVAEDLKILEQQMQLEIPFEVVNNLLEKETHYTNDLNSFLLAEKSKKKSKPKKKLATQDTLVTETMAKVYENQMLFSKAIDIYQQLSLKYPKKSALFALRIENLQKKL